MSRQRRGHDGSEAHQYAVATIPSILEDLVDLLGAPQVAAMVGVNRTTIHRWQRGAIQAINPSRESTIRAAAHARGILAHQDRGVIRSWFLTPNQLLGYESPVGAIATDSRQVLEAADSFIEHTGRAKVG